MSSNNTDLLRIYAAERQDDTAALALAFTTATAGFTYMIAAIIYVSRFYVPRECSPNSDACNLLSWLHFAVPVVPFIIMGFLVLGTAATRMRSVHLQRLEKALSTSINPPPSFHIDSGIIWRPGDNLMSPPRVRLLFLAVASLMYFALYASMVAFTVVMVTFGTGVLRYWIEGVYLFFEVLLLIGLLLPLFHRAFVYRDDSDASHLLEHSSNAIRQQAYVYGKLVSYWEYNLQKIGNSPTIVMLHGFRGNSRGLARTATLLDSYHLIIPDRPGYGDSDPLDKQHSLINYASWLDEFLSVIGVRNFATWGHSYGATIALIHAAQGAHEPISVVTVSAVIPQEIPYRWLATAYYEIGRFMPGRIRRLWLANQLVENATGLVLFRTARGWERRDLFAERNQDLPFLNLNVITEEYLSSRSIDLGAYTRRITLPVLYIGGDRDRIVPAEELKRIAAETPEETLNLIPSQGHMAPLELPSVTADCTARFLRYTSSKTREI